MREKKDCHMFIILISSISVSTIVHQKNGNASHKITEIIPWISEWFYYYENWLVTAKWLGGGIHRGKKE